MLAYKGSNQLSSWSHPLATLSLRSILRSHMHVCVCVCAHTHTHTHLQVRIPPDYVEVVLTLADADGSGEIEFAEFKGLFNNLDTPETLQRLGGRVVFLPCIRQHGCDAAKFWFRLQSPSQVCSRSWM